MEKVNTIYNFISFKESYSVGLVLQNNCISYHRY